MLNKNAVIASTLLGSVLVVGTIIYKVYNTKKETITVQDVGTGCEKTENS